MDIFEKDGTSLVAHMVKNLLAIWEIRFPGKRRSPGKGNGYQSSILAWSISWTEDPSGLQSMESSRVGHD